MSELTRLIDRRLLRGDERAIFYHGTWYSNNNLRNDIDLLKARFREYGVQQRDRILIAKLNSYEFIVAYLAVLLYGATVVPVNPEMPELELVKVGNRAQVTGAILGHEIVKRINVDKITSLRMLATIPEQLGQAQDIQFVGLGEKSLPQRETVEAESDWAGILLFTSGTTGTPKGVELTHQQLLATADQVIVTHHLTAEDISYCFLPLFHINAQVVALLSTLITGGRLLVEEKFSASRFWSTVEQHQVTWISAVPTVIGILIKGESDPVVPSSLRFVRSASAPLPALYAKRFEARFGVPIIESYGITEAGSQVCVNPLPPGKRKLGSVGRPAGVELKIVTDQDSVAPTGVVGEIAIRGKSVITHYAYGDTANGSFSDSWFFTGDLGYLDKDGYLFITGRKKEMINRAGQKISPREVEDVISQHHTVKTVAVIGLPDELYGERVTAYVVPETPSFDPMELQATLQKVCLDSLSKYKCPEEFHFVDSLPAGPTGKVKRLELRKEVLALGSL